MSYRKKFTGQEWNILEEEYKKTRFLRNGRSIEIAERLDCTPTQVKVRMVTQFSRKLGANGVVVVQ